MSGTPIPSANIDPSKQDVIAAIVQKELEGNSVFLPLTTDYSRFAGKGMKTFSILRRSVVSAIDKDCSIENPTQNFALATDTMTLDKMPYVSFVICDVDEIESVVSLDAEAARAAGGAIARHIDDAIITLLGTGAGYSAVTDGLATALDRDAVLNMKKYVECNYADDGVWVVGCEILHDNLLKQAEFSQNDIYGSAVIQNGRLSSLYGDPVIMSKRLGAGEAFYFSRQAIGYAAQQTLAFNVHDCPERGAMSKRYTWDSKYGLLLAQENELGAGVGKSPWIAKFQA